MPIETNFGREAQSKSKRENKTGILFFDVFEVRKKTFCNVFGEKS